MEKGPSRQPEARIDPGLAIKKATVFLERFGNFSPEQKMRAVSLLIRNGQTASSQRTHESPTHIVSESPETAKGKPTVVLLPGIFRETQEMAIDAAVIAHVFNAHVVVFDYASLASKGGMRSVLQGLPSLLESTEFDKNPPPSRILVGESLGGLVTQAVAFAGENDPELQQRLNIKHLVLSHTIPPQLIDGRLEFFARLLRLFGPHVPMGIARPVINAVVDRARRLNSHQEGQTMLDVEWEAVQDILREERRLTPELGSGYVRVALDAITGSRRHKTPTQVPTDIIISTTDKLFKSIPLGTWQKYHGNVKMTELNGPNGHATSGLKETYLAQHLVRLLAEVLPVAA